MYGIVKGPAAVAYGANSMGGVIDITTKRGTDTPVTTLAAALGSNGYRNLNASHSNRVGILRFWLSAYEHNSDGFRMSKAFESTALENGGMRNNSAYRKSGTNLRLGVLPSPDLTLSLSMGYHWARKDVPSSVFSWDNPTYRTFPEYMRSNLSLSGQWLPVPRILLAASMYYDGYHDRLLEFRTSARDEQDLNYNSFLGSYTLGGNVDVSTTIMEHHSICAGMHLAQDRMEKQPDTDLPYDRHSIVGGHFFLQDTYRPWESIQVNAGCLASFSERDGSTVSDFSPMASIRYELPFGFTLLASYARAIRYPALHHLYSQASGNPALLPEKAVKWEAGIEKTFLFRHESIDLAFECVLFRNDLSDLIYRSGTSYRYKNIAASVLQGIEFISRCTMYNSISLEAGYMMLDREASSTELMEEVSPQTVRVQLAIRTGFGLQAGYEFRGVGIRTTYIATHDLSPYQVHNIRLAQEIHERIRLSVEVQNIADVNFEDELGFPAPGRQYLAGLSYTY